MNQPNQQSQRSGQRAKAAAKEPQVTLGSFLQHARLESGIARRQLAAMSGVGRMTIQRLETDYYHTEPSADDLMRLARSLEINETDLFLLAGLPVPKKTASLDVMLRTGYGVNANDVPALKQQIEALIAEHAPPREQRKTRETRTEILQKGVMQRTITT